ncbi:MAG: NAD(+)/NADH kinase [Ruminococcaceae bacterium]|nr:NAD(+)/NADH kinase [Oscillospiraceae bacterium]
MNFFLYINNRKDKNFSVAEKAAEFLINKGADFYIESGMKDAVSDTKILSQAHFLSLNECVKSSDAAIVIGGDGTILKASKILYGTGIPIVGINLGKVGYMSELEKDEISHLEALFESNEKNICIDERMMLSCKVIRGDREAYKNVCLNEAVIGKGDIARMVDIELSLDGEFIAKYQCDGIITSTPTGSTAYSMSAGGAIIDPKIECISVVPLCPYLCINSSPIVFSKESVIEIRYKEQRGNTAYISVDGEEGFRLADGDTIVISKAEHNTKLLRFKKTGFYKLLNTKLTNRISELADKN